MTDAAALTGACDRGETVQLAASAYAHKEGCEVTMHKINDLYRGKTADGQCPSQLRGASYATAHVTVRPDGIHSWDRGYDEAGAQVWGAEKGPYRFARQDAAQKQGAPAAK